MVTDATIAFFIDDSRYSVPTLQFVDTSSEAAPVVARRLLDQSPNHCAVEARDEDRLLCRVVRELLPR